MSRGYEVLAQRRESMGVCFLQGTDYRDFIRAYGGRAQEEQGDIVFRETGQLVGRHDGLANYTVGQRRGMPVVDGVPLYVAGVDVGRNLIWADVKSSLFSNVLYLEQLNVIDGKDLEADDLTLRVRGIGLNPQGAVRVERLAGGRCRVWLSEAAWAVAPGQPVAFYRGVLCNRKTYGCSSVGRALVSKTRCREFESLLPCGATVWAGRLRAACFFVFIAGYFCINARFYVSLQKIDIHVLIGEFLICLLSCPWYGHHCI